MPASSWPDCSRATRSSSGNTSDLAVASAVSAGRLLDLAVSVSASAVSRPLGSVTGSVKPSLRPDSVMAWYHGLDLRSAANLLFALYPSTRPAVANEPYQETQPPFALPISVLSAFGLALMNTSPL